MKCVCKIIVSNNMNGNTPDKTYSIGEIRKLNSTYPWNHSISDPKVSAQPDGSKQKYALYPTGDADLNGRKYVSLPVGINTSDPVVRKKYNLW